MSWYRDLPDEAFKAMILGGVGVCAVGGVMLEIGRQQMRRVAHAVVCIGFLTFGAGVTIAALRESKNLNGVSLDLMGAGVVATTLSYGWWIATDRLRVRWMTTRIAFFTLLAMALTATSFDQRDCACGPPTTLVEDSTPHT